MKSFTERVPPELLLDLTIAAQMRPHADLFSRLDSLGLNRNLLKTIARTASQAGVIDRKRILWDDVVQYFGAPAHEGSDYAAYHLSLWPAHQFRFGIHEPGWVSQDGFELTVPEAMPIAVSEVQIHHLTGLLRQGYHTTAEANGAFGRPRLVQGWERMEDWYYSVPGEDRDVVLEFDFGLLTSLGRRKPIIMSK
jgi:hypothetical protein